jgi:3-oxoacyl-[acyl-carrier protein] reductase
MGKLEHKVAIVTGASKGIGASIARHLAAEGAAVVVNYAASREGADRVGADIARAGGRAVAIHGDLARPADVDRLFAETAKAFGRLDILVNNAGIYEFRPLEEITPEHFHQHFDLNVLGVLLASRAAAAHFGAAGGSIVNISSGATTLIPANSAVYTVTKAALDAITGVLAKELGPRGIRVDAVNPGMVDTEGVRAAGFDQSDLRQDVVTASRASGSRRPPWSRRSRWATTS